MLWNGAIGMPVKKIWEVPSVHLDAPTARNMQVVFTPQKDPGMGDLTLLIVNLYPHTGTTGLHIHADGDEMILITGGRGEGVEGGQKFEIVPDTVVYAKKGVEHCITNTSDETMRLVCVFSPAMGDERVKSLTESASLKFKKV